MSALSFNTPGEREKSLWLIKKENDPAHSQWYIDRFKAMEAEGKDMAGESRLVNALASRGAKILDAGSGPGRDYAFAQFLEDAREVGLNIDSTFSSWDLRPFAEGSEFIVAVLSR